MAAMAVPMLLVYMAYYWGNGNAMTMCFMLPTFGLYILAGLWLVRQCTAREAWPAAAGVAVAIVAVQFLWGVPEFLNTARRLSYQKEMLARITVALDKVAQPGDVVVVGNAVGQQLDFVRRSGKWPIRTPIGRALPSTPCPPASPSPARRGRSSASTRRTTTKRPRPSNSPR